jgi:hypothetical protein
MIHLSYHCCHERLLAHPYSKSKVVPSGRPRWLETGRMQHSRSRHSRQKRLGRGKNRPRKSTIPPSYRVSQSNSKRRITVAELSLETWIAQVEPTIKAEFVIIPITTWTSLSRLLDLLGQLQQQKHLYSRLSATRNHLMRWRCKTAKKPYSSTRGASSGSLKY